jgi:ATP-dependent RNA helicase DeaD
MTPFDTLGLAEPILAALHDVGYENPSPIQEQAIPELLNGRDVIGQARPAPARPPPSGCR